MGKKAILKVYGDIGESVPDMFFMEGPDTVSAKQVSEFLDQNQDADEIIVKINSRGGDVQEGWAIHDLLINSGKKISTIGEGKVYSIATIIFLAGEERSMMQNADGLIHNPFIPEYTLADKYESTDLLKIAESLAQEEEKILDFYALRTGTDKAKLATYMKDETKLSANDMLTLGFATKILEPVKAYAFYKLKNLTIMKETEEKAFFERLGTLLDSKIAKAFSRLPEGKNIELTDTSGNTLTVDKPEGDPAVGDKASPDGTFVMDNGDTIIVTNGMIESITPQEAEPGDGELEKAQAEIQRLKDELAAATAKVAEVETEKVAFAKKEKEASDLITELRNLKNSWKPEGRASGEGGQNKVDGIDLDRVKEIIKNSKS